MIINDGGRIATGAVGEAARLAGLHVPYLWGGNSLKGMDCSGMVQWCMSVGGYPNLPKDRRLWTTATLRALGTTIPNGQEKAGDLIFPDSGHVGIFIAGNTFIDAPTTGTTVGQHNFKNYNNGKYTVVRIVDPVPAAGSLAGLIGNLASQGNLGALAPIPGELVADPALDPIAAALAPLTNIITAISKPLAWLSEPAHWVQIGMVIGGAVVLLFGVIALEHSA